MFAIVLSWEAFKDWLAATIHVTHWDLHVIVGVSLFKLFGRLTHRPLTSFLPLLPVAGLEAINEAFDFGRYVMSGWPWTPRSTLIEIALTLLPSMAIIAAARLARRTQSGGNVA